MNFGVMKDTLKSMVMYSFRCHYNTMSKIKETQNEKKHKANENI